MQDDPQTGLFYSGLYGLIKYMSLNASFCEPTHLTHMPMWVQNPMDSRICILAPA